MINVKPFDKGDWLAFNGAESFPDGSPPKMGSMVVDGWPADVVWDAHGVGVFWVEEVATAFDDEEWVDNWVLFPNEVVNAPALLERLGERMTVAELVGLGGELNERGH